jgi:hypothetical protein
MDKGLLEWILVVSPAALWACAANLGYRVIHKLSVDSLFPAMTNQSADLAIRRAR